jgi:Caspase domain
MDGENDTTQYAILIGINSYVESPLRGCVRDVVEMKKYLSSLPVPVQVYLFTADTTRNTSPSHSVEDSGRRPTYDNVKSALREVISQAKPGDSVYIHYSGHGTRMRASQDPTSTYTGDVALNLLQGPDSDQILYLRGLELAHSIRNIVAKGSLVTLILDCCFSGGVSRRNGDDDPDPENIRFLSYNADADADVDAVDPSPDPDPRFNSSDVGPSGPASARDASTLPSWVVDPDGYTIFAACGPREKARELEFDGDGQRRGALSYLLLRCLEDVGGWGRTQQQIYDHLRARFREYCPGQNPVHYGNGTIRFFGPPGADVANADLATVSVVRGVEETTRLSVQAGRAHGVCDGDVFALYPFFYLTGAKAGKDAEGGILARVTRVAAFTADLEELSQRPSQRSVRTGWYARAVTRASLGQYPIHLSRNLPNLDRWQSCCKERPSLKVNYHNEGIPTIQVVPNGHSGYDVRDGSNQSVPNVPSLSHNRSPDDILDVVEHLVRFQHVRDITNPSVAFRDLFTAQLVSPSGETSEAGQLVKIRSGDTMMLEVRNRGSRTLYLHVYGMGPRWEVQNALKGTYEAIPARDPVDGYSGVTRKKLKMTVPAEMIREGWCEDIVKVFITAQPTSFACLEMPRVGEVAKAGAGRGPLVGGGVEEGSDDWAALNFEFHITV